MPKADLGDSRSGKTRLPCAGGARGGGGAEGHMQCDKVGRTAFHQVLEDIDLGTNPGEDLLEEVTPSLRLEAGKKETDFQEEETGNTGMEILNLSKPTTQALAMAGTSISPNVIPRPASAASLEKMEEIQIHGPQLRPTKSGTLRNQPAVCFDKPPSDLDAYSFENHCPYSFTHWFLLTSQARPGKYTGEQDRPVPCPRGDKLLGGDKPVHFGEWNDKWCYNREVT